MRHARFSLQHSPFAAGMTAFSFEYCLFSLEKREVFVYSKFALR
jgi:hypothetical protein